jgi:predicted Zn-dependent protease
MYSVVLHELGHALGLAHVNDASEVMYPEAQIKVTDLGAGDRRGLAALGSGTCESRL